MTGHDSGMSQVAVHIVESPHSKLQPAEHVTSHDEVAAPHVVLQPPGQPETVHEDPSAVQIIGQPPVMHATSHVAFAPQSVSPVQASLLQ